jgi:putative membrane protein
MSNGISFFGIITMLLPLLVLVVFVAVIVWAVRRLSSGGMRSGAGVHEPSAEEILRQRFARGEIGTEEYEERRRILNEQHRTEEDSK